MSTPTPTPYGELPEILTDHACNDIYGGNWRLVRHSYDKWYTSTDQMTGQDEYGILSDNTYPNNPKYDNDYSLKFYHLLYEDTNILFSDGDCNDYIVTSYEWIMPGNKNYQQPILNTEKVKKQSSNGNNNANWYVRSPNFARNDPIICLEKSHIIGSCLYIEGNYGTKSNRFESNKYLNVWIQINNEDKDKYKYKLIPPIPDPTPYNKLPKIIENHNCQSIENGNWLLVRHSYNKFHQATDHMIGIEEYGGNDIEKEYPNNPYEDKSYSINFYHLLYPDTKIMFSDGKCNHFIVTTFDWIFPDKHGTLNGVINNPNKVIKQSDIDNINGQWYAKSSVNYNPVICLGGWNPHSFDSVSKCLYVGASYNQKTDRFKIDPYLNVWIQINENNEYHKQLIPELPQNTQENEQPKIIENHPCQKLDNDDGNWILVRHSYNKFHQANDHMSGIQEYGKNIDDNTYPNNPYLNEEYSIKFNNLLSINDDNTKILFSDGKCLQYIITTYDWIYPDRHLSNHAIANKFEAVLSSSGMDNTFKWSSIQRLNEDPKICFNCYFFINFYNFLYILLFIYIFQFETE